MYSKDTLCVSSKWNYVDIIRKDRVVIGQEYLISFPDSHETPTLVHASHESIISAGACFPYTDDSGAKVLWDVESGSRRVLFVECKLPNAALGESEAMSASAALPGTFVHVLCSKTGRKLKTIKLPTEKSGTTPAVHGKVYGSSHQSKHFSACRFCPTNPNKLIFLAEAPKVNANNEETPSIPEKSPFVLKESWGEGLSGITRPVICLLDVETEEVVCVQSKLEKLAPESIHWSFDEPHYTPDGNGIIFVAYDNNPYPLGLIYCHQRASKLLYWNFETSQLQCLSRGAHAVCWPRFSPDNSKLIWFEVPASGPHGQCFEMLAHTWPPSQPTPEVIVPLVALPKDESDFPGLYLGAGVRERCWTSDSKAVVLSTTWGAETALVHINVDGDTPNRITRFPSPLEQVEGGGGHGTVCLMDLCDDVLVASVSSPSVPNFIAVAKLSHENVCKTCWLNLSLTGENQPVVPFVKGLAWRVLSHSADIADERFGVKRFESILIHPTSNSANLQLSIGPHHNGDGIAWKSTLGLVVIPHGGPHSVFTAEWLPQVASYVGAGFACLLINYRGSTGYGNCSVYSLPGKCGTNDVADCVQATKEALRELSSPDLPCVLLGGSHGGFLVLHLAGRHAAMYRAVVARNPVTNLVSMLSTSDIPDWCWTEAGIGVDETRVDPKHPEKLCREWTFDCGFCPTKPEDLTRLASCSPIIHISSAWSVPVLMCLGAKDARVPNEQGIGFMRTLRAHLGQKAGEAMLQTLRFPTESHPLESPAASQENFVRALEWFYSALGLIQE
ncbi:unnamed protein product [Mesocestoides corti]|uniref:Acylamino-acid-releasing enzyme n=1 Tax=Mesocestoides corti TaxID=53468 RepID=A0A3P6I771_MESCO|nr:unnamed protein product [Mesocestoides corti]